MGVWGSCRGALVAPYGLRAPTRRVSRRATWLWRDVRGRRAPSPLQVRPWSLGPTRGRSSPPRGDALHLVRLRPSLRCPSRREAQITLTRGQDHREASSGLLCLEAVGRAHFPGDSPPEVTGAVRGCPPRSTPTSSTLLRQHRVFRARLRTQVPGDGLRGRVGASQGLVMPVPGDFTAALQRNGSDFTRH